MSDGESKARIEMQSRFGPVVIEAKRALGKKDDLVTVLAELCVKFQHQKATLWEERLRLVLKPRPAHCPLWLYTWALNLVLRQEQKAIEHSLKAQARGLAGEMP